MGDKARTSVGVGIDAKEADRKLKALSSRFGHAGDQIESSFGRSIENVQGRLGVLGELLGGAASRAGATGLALGAAGAALIAFGASASSAAASAERLITQQSRMAARLSIGIESFTGLSDVARRYGADAEDVADVLGELTQRALNNEKDFQSFGIATRDANGVLLDTQTLFENVADRIAKASTATEAFAIADDLASDAGRRLLPVLRRGSDAIERQIDVAQRRGELITREQEQLSGSYRHALDEAAKAFGALGRQIGVSFMPIIEVSIELVTDMTRAARILITPFTDLIQLFGELAGGGGRLLEVQRSSNQVFASDTRPKLEEEKKLRKSIADEIDRQRQAITSLRDEQISGAEAAAQAAFLASRRRGGGDVIAVANAQIGKLNELSDEIASFEGALARARIRNDQEVAAIAERELEGLRVSFSAAVDVSKELLAAEREIQEQRLKAQRAYQKVRTKQDREEAKAEEKAAEDEAALLQGRLDNQARWYALSRKLEQDAADRAEEEAERRQGLGFAGRLTEDFEAALDVVVEKGSLLNQGLARVANQGVQTFAQMGGAIAASLQASFQGGDFGAALAQILGGQLVSLGTSLVNAGVYTLTMAQLAAIPIIGLAFGGPPASAMGLGLAPVAIAAGAGLIAAGSALGAHGAAVNQRATARSGASTAGGRGSQIEPRAFEGDRFPRSRGRFRGDDLGPGRAPVIVNVNFNAPQDPRRAARALKDLEALA